MSIYNEKLVKELVFITLTYIPGIAKNIDYDDIIVNDEKIIIHLKCNQNLPVCEILTIVQKNVYDSLISRFGFSKTTVDVILKEIVVV